jgi:methyl-accepting chemotaxis protein
MAFNDQKIGVKLGGVFGFLLVSIAAIICLGLTSTKRVHGSLETIAKGNYVKTLKALKASQALDDLCGSIRMLVLLKDEQAISQEKQKNRGSQGTLPGGDEKPGRDGKTGQGARTARTCQKRNSSCRQGQQPGDSTGAGT